MKKYYFLAVFMMLGVLVGAQIPVTFAVDMNDVPDFDPTVDVMRIGGDFQGWSPANTTMTDDDGNGVWSVTVTEGIDAGQSILFKFVINDWGTNEFIDGAPATGDCYIDDGAGNVNRQYVIPSDVTEHMMPIYLYNACEESTLSVSVKEISTIQGIKVSPNPIVGVSVVTFENPTNAAHDITLSSITGQALRSWNGVTGTSLEVAKGDLPAGLYLLTFQNELGEIGAQKLIVQ